MSSTTPYLIDQLENAGLLEIDGLYSDQFSLDEALLDQADAAAEANLPFASEAMLLRIEVMDGRQLRRWQFSYNQILEAAYVAADDSWRIEVASGVHLLKCLEGVAASTADDY